MGNQILKDRNGMQRGIIKTSSNGIMTIFDRTGSKTLGTYDPKRDKTYDKQGSTIGSGNLLTTLLVD